MASIPNFRGKVQIPGNLPPVLPEEPEEEE